LYAPPLDHRQSKPPATPAPTQGKFGDIIPHYNISRIQRREIGTGIHPSCEAHTPWFQDNLLDGPDGYLWWLGLPRRLIVVIDLGSHRSDVQCIGESQRENETGEI
jgi:hypothetical protein